MHLLIGNNIAERLKIEDRTSFLLGSIAPDAVHSKDSSHFFKGEHRDFTRYIDYYGFFEKYKACPDQLYVLGYFVHLIADDLWLKGFYIPWLKNRMDNDSELYALYHNDFRLLNGKLLEHYGSADKLRSLISAPCKVTDLDEVKSTNVTDLVSHVLGDMDYDKKDLDTALRVFHFIQIEGYIETAVNMGVMHLESLG
ncbi:zinc dependent phospholipase C family protein [Paenibacillus oryzae]|nr:zinc dependent phospholipase C family protein [Paenibacillus oryzae]